MNRGDMLADEGNTMTWITFGKDHDDHDGLIYLESWECERPPLGIGIPAAIGYIEWCSSDDEFVAIERPSP
jgi:hypothetical protein